MKIMKKFYLVFLVLGMFVGFLSSCDDDDKYRPDALELEIVSKSGAFTVAKEDTLFLKAKLNNPQEVKFSWTMNGQQVSSDSVYMFIAANMGNYKIDVKATDGKEETTVSASVEVYGKYKYGTFILNEGQVWKEHYGTLAFISPKGIVTDSVYYKENGGSLGGGTQDLYIRNNKLYIISQNGGNDGGFLTIANAETLKKESSYEDELGSTLSMPSHIAVLDDNDIYIRDNNGVYRFNPSSKVLTLKVLLERTKRQWPLQTVKFLRHKAINLSLSNRTSLPFQKKYLLAVTFLVLSHLPMVIYGLLVVPVEKSQQRL